MQPVHLPWTTMGLFPVLLCTTNTCSMTAMIAGGEVHRPSGVQHNIWNWVTLWSSPDCRRRCGGTMPILQQKYHCMPRCTHLLVHSLPWGWWCWWYVLWNHPALWLVGQTHCTLHTSAPLWCYHQASTGDTPPMVKRMWLQDLMAVWAIYDQSV